MFVGWIRQKTFEDDIQNFSVERIIDKNLVINTIKKDPSLCYGVYEEDKLLAFITAYEFDKMILINNFFYLENIDLSVRERLIKLLMSNIDQDEKSIVVLSRIEEQELFQGQQFIQYAPFKKMVYTGASKAFSFSNTTAKSISNEHFIPMVTKMDEITFQEDRTAYLLHAQYKSSSLVLSCSNGYQHSYAIAQNLIKISPWINQNGAYDDAQKLIRGVIYHRGLKRIVAFAPVIEEIQELYNSYGFQSVDDFMLMYANQKPQIDLEKVYAF